MKVNKKQMKGELKKQFIVVIFQLIINYCFFLLIQVFQLLYSSLRCNNIFKQMSQKHGSSKISQSFQMGKIKRKNSLSGTSGPKDFQLSEQQAQLIQSKLPKNFKIIKVGTGELEKYRQQLRVSSAKNIQQHQTKPEILIEDKKIQKKASGKIKRAANPSSKNIVQDAVSQQNQQLIERNQKVKKELAHKKKLPLKYNIEPHQEIAQSLQQMNDNSEKAAKKIKILESAKQKNSTTLQVKQQPNQPYAEPQPLKQHHQIMNSYIPSLPNCEPRHVPLSPDFEYDGDIEVNTLRYFYGLGYKPPVQEAAKLNQKQKNFCTHIVQRLKAHKSSQPFKVAVDPQGQGVPDYYHVVYNPMDLQTIHRKIVKDKYKQISEFHLDVNTIILNSYKYNLRQTTYFQLTVEFQDYYQSLLHYAQKNPLEFSKQYIPKCVKKKTVEDLGQLDFTQKTPIKQKKKQAGGKINQNQGQKQRKPRAGKIKNSYQDANVSGMISSFNNDQLSQNQNEGQKYHKKKLFQKIQDRKKEQKKIYSNQQSQNNERSRQKPSKQAVMKNLYMNKAHSMPLQKQDLDIFSQSQFHNTQSNTSNLIYPNSYNSYNQYAKKKPKIYKSKKKIQKAKQMVQLKQKQKSKSNQTQIAKDIQKQKYNQIQQQKPAPTPIFSHQIPQNQQKIIKENQEQQIQVENPFQNQMQIQTQIQRINQDINISKPFPQLINKDSNSKSRKMNILNDDYNDIDQLDDNYFKQDYDKLQEQEQGSQLDISVLGVKVMEDESNMNNQPHNQKQLDFEIQDLVEGGIYQFQDNRKEKISRNYEQVEPSKVKNTYVQPLLQEVPQFYVPTKPKNKFTSSNFDSKVKKQKPETQKVVMSGYSTLPNLKINNPPPVTPAIINSQSISNSQELELRPNQITMYLNTKKNITSGINQQNRSSQKYKANTTNINNQQKYITINNLNTHPVQYKDIKDGKQMVEQIKIQHKVKQEQILQNILLPNDISKEAYQAVVPKTKPIAKPRKNKNKDKDDEYCCSSQGEEFVLNEHRYTKRGKKKTTKNKTVKQIEDSSEDGNPIKRRRGRQPRKIKESLNITANINSNVPTISQKYSQLKRNQTESFAPNDINQQAALNLNLNQISIPVPSANNISLDIKLEFPEKIQPDIRHSRIFLDDEQSSSSPQNGSFDL